MDKLADIKKLWAKIMNNSFYPEPTETIFYFYSPGMAEKVTEEGKKAMRKIIKYFDK